MAKNTIITYLYRDASNYKQFNHAIVEGELTNEQIEEIFSCLSEGEYFIPSQVGLPEKRFEDGWTEDDHVWFELCIGGICPTGEETVTADVTAEELLENFRRSKDNWDEAAAYERLALNSQP